MGGTLGYAGALEDGRVGRGVIFVDTNVFVYAVGRDHPLREEARAFLEESVAAREALVTSAEVYRNCSTFTCRYTAIKLSTPPWPWSKS